MIALIIKITVAIELAENFFWIMTATISAPPVEPPILKAKATAVPIQTPAVSAAKIFSAGSIKVIWKLGKAFSITVKNSVCKRICAAVRQANFRFTKKNAKIVNGALIQINTADCGIMPEVALLIKIATPLAPPIVKSLAEISE